MCGRVIEWWKIILYLSTDIDNKNILIALEHFSEEILSFSYISGSTVIQCYSMSGRMTLNRMEKGIIFLPATLKVKTF